MNDLFLTILEKNLHIALHMNRALLFYFIFSHQTLTPYNLFF